MELILQNCSRKLGSMDKGNRQDDGRTSQNQNIMLSVKSRPMPVGSLPASERKEAEFHAKNGSRECTRRTEYLGAKDLSPESGGDEMPSYFALGTPDLLSVPRTHLAKYQLFRGIR